MKEVQIVFFFRTEKRRYLPDYKSGKRLKGTLVRIRHVTLEIWLSVSLILTYYPYMLVDAILTLVHRIEETKLLAEIQVKFQGTVCVFYSYYSENQKPVEFEKNTKTIFKCIL